MAAGPPDPSALLRDFEQAVKAGDLCGSPLPDFSYAGYHQGTAMPPRVAGPVFKLTDFGAVPGDGKDDVAAIQRAIDAAAKAGGDSGGGGQGGDQGGGGGGNTDGDGGGGGGGDSGGDDGGGGGDGGPGGDGTGPGGDGGSGSDSSGGSDDPNSLSGPGGFGSPHFVAASTSLPYRVSFENARTATAPAQQVTVTNHLPPNLDWTTFQLTGIGWGDFNLTIPAGSQHYQTTVPMTYNGRTFDVDVETGIHAATGQVYATFISVDPTTQLPPDVLTGFLPPENGTGMGIGYISYTVRPKAGLPTGTPIRNVAGVVFDGQPVIMTDQVSETDPGQGTDPNKEALVTIDAVAPTSHVAALSATTGQYSFTVNWNGQDDTGGSGIASYDIYVSDNGGAFAAWLTNQPATITSGAFTGSPGHTYAFYGVATDNVGNREAKTTADTQTQVIDATPPTSHVSALPATTSQYSFTVNWSGQDDTGGSGVANYDIYVSDNGAAYALWQDHVSATSATFAGQEGHTYGFYSQARDKAGNLQAAPAVPDAQIQVMDTTPPTSSVQALPATESSSNFTVTWAGQDDAGGSGLASYSVYVSDNGGAYTLWKNHTTTTSANFAGTFGHSYAFYSVATDNAGNTQATPAAAQALTAVNPAGLVAGPGAAYSITGALGSQTLRVTAGTITLNSDLYSSIPNLNLNISGRATVIVNAPQHLGALNIAQSGLGAYLGSLDLGSSTLVLSTGGASAWIPLIYSGISGMVASGYHGGAWDGAGIRSSAAAGDATMNHGLGVIVSGTDIVVEYGWNGDVNGDGAVDYLDYGTIDNAYLYNQSNPDSPQVGYANGDLNFDGAINYLDYGMMDNAFLAINAPQSTAMAAAVEGAVPLASSAPVVPSASLFSTASLAFKPASDSSNVLTTVDSTVL